jgi:Tfp pilus assembly PilM family ATPase
LSKPEEISSTEKLLDLIRKNSDTDEYDASAGRPGIRRGASLSRLVPFGRSLTIGIDIHYDALKLVKVQHVSEKRMELLDHVTVPFQAGLSISDQQFVRLLKKTLAEFCGVKRKVACWCLLSSAGVEAQYLRIPKVAKKQIPKAAFWAYNKKAAFEESEKVFDFEIVGEIIERGMPKYEIFAYTAPVAEIETLRTVFERSGFPLEGISIAPFAFQNLLKTHWLQFEDRIVSCLYVGRTWSRIDIFSNGTLVLSRGIKAGMQSMIEAIREALDESRFDQVLAEIEDPEPGAEGTAAGDIFTTPLVVDAEKAASVFHAFLEDRDFLPDPEGGWPDPDRVFSMIRPALDRLVRQVERTMEHFVRNYESEHVTRILVSGPVSAHDGITGYIGEQLGIPTGAVDPFPPHAPVSSVLRKPDTVAEKDALAPAVGMALSSNTITPNFVFTYKDRGLQENFDRVKRIVMGGCTLLLALCLLWSFELYNEIDKKTERNEAVIRQADLNAPYSDRNMILQMVLKIRQNHAREERYGRSYLSVAAIGELCSLAPEGIRLADVKANFGPLPKKGKPRKPGRILIEGVIEGGRLKQEAELAEYLERLQNSPLFVKPRITAKEVLTINNREVLLFSASASTL